MGASGKWNGKGLQGKKGSEKRSRKFSCDRGNSVVEMNVLYMSFEGRGKGNYGGNCVVIFSVKCLFKMGVLSMSFYTSRSVYVM